MSITDSSGCSHVGLLSNLQELEAAQGSGWGLVQQGDSALLWHSDKPGGLCPPEHSQDRKAKTQDGFFSAALGSNPGPCTCSKRHF